MGGTTAGVGGKTAARALGYAPDRAIRGRLGAILLDGFLLGLAYRFLLPALGVQSAEATVLWILVLQFLYFFLLEAFAGKTLGKARAHVRVVSLDGTPPTLGQLAIRNALRIFDALPLFYASGLVSVMWSGPGQRQRLGDRVAGTSVILEPGGKPRPTPGWLLPALTSGAVLLSIVIYGALYNEYRTPSIGENALAPIPVPGYSGDNSQPPDAGRFTAQAMLNGAPAVDPSGKPVTRDWEIAKSCTAATTCSYKITRSVPDLGQETGPMVAESDGWHVDFPTHGFRVQCPGRGVMTVMRRASFVFHFEPGGRAVEAHERTLYKSENCGAFTTGLDWTASHVTLGSPSGLSQQ